MKKNLKTILAGLSTFALISTTTPTIVNSYSLNPPKLIVQTKDRDMHVDVNDKDHSKLVYTRYNNKLNMSKIVTNKEGIEKILTQGYRDFFPKFNPEGDKIAFYRGLGLGSGLLCVMDSDGKNLKEITATNSIKPSWSPDGKFIVFEDILTEKEDYVITQKDIEILKNKYNTNNIGYKPGDKIKIDVKYSMLSIIEIETKKVTYLTEKSKGIYDCPEFTSDGKILYTFKRDKNSDSNELWIMKNDGSDKQLVFKPESYRKEVPDKNSSGSTIYRREGKIKQLSSDGNNVAFLLGTRNSIIKKEPSAKYKGDFYYNQVEDVYSQGIYIMNLETKEMKLVTDEGLLWFPELKGDKVYFSRYEDQTEHDIYIIDLKNIKK